MPHGSQAAHQQNQFRDLFVESFGWYAFGNYIYITMEYLPHGDLQQYLSQPLREDETQQIASQVVRGLEWMHMLKFIHRDLKPAVGSHGPLVPVPLMQLTWTKNLLVVDMPPEKNWWVKIGDFGISKRAAKGDEDFSTVLGTAGYMAPEVSPGEPGSQKAKYTRAADMWALGAICVRLMTGGPAFHPKGLHDYYHYNGPFTPDKALSKSGTSPDGCDFIRKLMARTPSQRLTAEEAAAHNWINSGQAGLLAAHGTAVCVGCFQISF
jgi:calcium/calmodulin-dependent protein kinase I